jgi:hypothetical protein
MRTGGKQGRGLSRETDLEREREKAHFCWKDESNGPSAGWQRVPTVSSEPRRDPPACPLH